MPWDVIRSIAVLFFVLLMSPAAFAQVPPVGAMPTGKLTTTPIGHVGFCRAFPDECVRRGGTAPVRLSDAAFSEIVRINLAVNRGIAPVTDADYYGRAEHWTLPRSSGDCEDYALLKRQQLIARGWPSGTLLIAVVFDEIGDGHAVLVVRTSKGDLVLDNRTDQIRQWHRTPYRFVKRQSVQNPRRWVSISDFAWRSRSVSSLD